ncbi:MAG: ATP-dependent sacrificial sulfur transferase LarE [Candidatus Hodarchaeota archaeon]
MNKELEEKIQKGFNTLKDRSAIVAFSGGVDSSVVAVLAKSACRKIKLITIKSEVISDNEIKEANLIGDLVGVPHETIVLSVDSDHFWSNPPDRCFYCKKAIFGKLKEIAKESGYDIVIDGTNASDIKGHRPGFRALKELGILSPLLIGNLTKSDVREIASEYGLSVAKKPAMACLASRIPYGEEITINKLKRVELGENFLHELAISKQIRLRDHGNLARIEIDPIDIPRLFEEKFYSLISEKLKEIGYTYVTLDLEGYRPSIPE